MIKKIKLPFKIKKPILALGAHTKNTVSFAKSTFLYVSPVYQNLNNPDDFFGFEKTVKFFLKKNPKIVAYDPHPEYQSTKYLQRLSSDIPARQPGRYHLAPIQHHHSHIASCMIDNQLQNQKVIGVAFDGTGLGGDNHIWGAEFLICDYKNFQRRAHLAEIPLLGAERAILEPWRLAAAWLYRLYKDKFFNFDIRIVKLIDKNKWGVLKKMYLSQLNSPLASSMGRLFDAVACLVLEKGKADFEAELAMELEMVAASYRLHLPAGQAGATGYPFKIIKDKSGYIIDPLPMFKEVVLDLKAKEPKKKIAFRFHLGIAQIVRKTCLILRDESRINRVVLSGGVFQNKLLLKLVLDLLYKDKFRVFIHQKLSCNDSGISPGQAVIANFSSGD